MPLKVKGKGDGEGKGKAGEKGSGGREGGVAEGGWRASEASWKDEGGFRTERKVREGEGTAGAGGRTSEASYQGG